MFMFNLIIIYRNTESVPCTQIVLHIHTQRGVPKGEADIETSQFTSVYMKTKYVNWNQCRRVTVSLLM